MGYTEPLTHDNHDILHFFVLISVLRSGIEVLCRVFVQTDSRCPLH